MTRGRKPPDEEAARELVEADLARLGNARVYLKLIYDRLEVIAQGSQASLIVPALGDLKQADRLICQTQVSIRSWSCPSDAPPRDG